VEGHGALLGDLAEQLARLAGLALDEETVRAAHQLAALVVVARQAQVPVRERRRAPGRADATATVLQADVALGLAVRIDDLRDSEALLERDPDVGTETGTGREAELMVLVARRRRRAHEVTAELADVGEDRRAVAADVVEEQARAELAA